MASIASSVKKLGTLRKGKLNDERGDVAVLTAIFVMVLLTLLPLVAYTAAVGQQPSVSFDQKYQGALGAAEAGVAAFVSELNANPPSTASTTNCVGNVPVNSYCLVSASTSPYWEPVQATAAGSTEFYEFEGYGSSAAGPFTVVSTGKTAGAYGNVYRTVEETVKLQKTGGQFTSYFLFANSQGNNVVMTKTSNFYGAVMTNGRFAQGNSNNCNLTDSFPGSSSTSSPLYSSAPNSSVPCLVSYSPPLNWPPDLSTISSAANSGGCTYLGPTYIQFARSNNQGGYYVESPGTPNTGGTGCYPSFGGFVAADSTGNSNGAIYVAASTSSCSSAITFYNSDGQEIYSGPCTAGSAVVEGLVNGNFTIGTASNIFISADLCYYSSTSNACGQGGSASGGVLGLAAAQNVLVGNQVDGNPADLLAYSGENYGFDTCVNPESSTYPTIPAPTSPTNCNLNAGSVYYISGSIMAAGGTFAFPPNMLSKSNSSGNSNSAGNSAPIYLIGSVAVASPCNSDSFSQCNKPSDGYLQQSNGANGPVYHYDQYLLTAGPNYFPSSSSSVSWYFSSSFTEVSNQVMENLLNVHTLG